MLTQEEIRDFFQKEENKELFTEVAKSMEYQSKEDIDGLVNKKNQLLGEVRNYKDKFNEAQKRLDEFDLDGYNSYIESQKSQGQGSESTSIQRENKKLADLLAKEQANREKFENNFKKIVKRDELQKAYRDNNIDPKHYDLLLDAHLSKAKVEIEENGNNVYFDDGEGLGLPVNEHIKKWIENGTGKEYLTKPENSGANSRSFSSGGSKTMSQSEFNNLSNANRAIVSKQIASGQIKLTD